MAQVSVTVPPRPIMLTDGSNVDMTTQEQSDFRDAIGASLTSGLTFIADFVQARLRTGQDKMRDLVSLADFGPLAGDNTTDDAPAFKRASAAMATAAAFGIALNIIVPAPAVAYKVVLDGGTTVTMQDGCRWNGLGFPIINCSGSGTLFENNGKVRTEIDHLQIFGAFAANAWAIRHTTTLSGAIGNHYHHCFIKKWGNGTTGNAISIESDSANCEFGPQLFLSGLGDIIKITAPMDNVNIHHDVFATPSEYPTGPCRAVNASGGGGSTTQRLAHCNVTTEGLGTLKLNGGYWLIDDMDVETTKPFTNGSAASFELLGGDFKLSRNTVSMHGQTGANYAVYCADGVSVHETLGTYNGFLTKAVRVNSTAGNSYGPSLADTGQGNLYSADNYGIVQSTGQSSPGLSWGFGATAVPPTGYGFNGPLGVGPVNFTNNETGANNALVTTYFMPLQSLLTITIPLNHSLQAGANTISYNATVKNLRSRRNPASNIAAAYVAGGLLTCVYDGTQWLDVSQ